MTMNERQHHSTTQRNLMRPIQQKILGHKGIDDPSHKYQKQVKLN